ncbi:methyltransferase domain-containing protein [Colletotrichum godetiae]|uniref:Methyltransferase domain-containing protein n=1 Tax=Colletotrichum godetiae TaxID=1209918 RepID=A0AAJ0A7G0_9PEZI|nr:methyltransferase domain-containing protein [Colletotrichum godetiae]KAK1657449.1 methyltransferase domain-containing protein [Colletotrichum godetiae]
MDAEDNLEVRDEDANDEAMDSDLDSAIEDMEPSAQADLLSITSSIFDYQFENGRSYHSMSEGNLQHHLWLVTLEGELATSPGRETAKRVLDLGTGTGIWAIDFGELWLAPKAVIGVDLSAVQPDLVPANCSFEIDDLELDWPWEQPFDYIFSRSAAGSWSDFRAIIQRAYDHLEPGGYFEVQDLELPSFCDDGSVPTDAALYRWEHALVDASNELGRPLNYARDCLDDLHDVGFVEIHHQLYKWPCNNWPEDPYLKEVGRWNCANLDMGVEAFSLGLLTRVKGWTRDAVEELCTEVKREVKDTRRHTYWRQ